MASVHDQIVQNNNMTNQARVQQMTENGVRKSSTSVSSHDFLYLLTQQLQYQDPTNPMDNSEMLAQEAQFATLEQIENMSSNLSSFTSNFQANMLLGQCVRVEVDGQGYVGYVDAVDYTSTNGASILIGDRWFPMSSVTNTYYISGEAQPSEPTDPENPSDSEKVKDELDKTKDGLTQEANPDVMLPTAGKRICDVPTNNNKNEENKEGNTENTSPVGIIKSAGKDIIKSLARQAYEAVRDAL